MPNGVRDMGSNTAIKLFLMIGMKKLNLPTDAQEGDLFLDPIKNRWLVFKDNEWIDVELKKYYTSNDGCPL